MKKTSIITLMLVGLCVTIKAQIKEAEQVIRNFAPKARVELLLVEKENGCDVFETSVQNGVIKVKGSSGTALCRGFYDFVKSGGYGINSWSGNRIALPTKLQDTPTKRIVSPVEHHYYLNMVTYGYTMPYWDWNRWSQEIDYMALHGIDMPLALVANEAISARVWKQLGLTDEQIAAYFVGPAHFPWMRGGNISSIDGPLPQSWHEGQVAMQHKILDKMRGLGMKPICPGFAGFVPKELNDIYPDAKIVETHWGGAFNNWMIMPGPLFSKIGTMFIQEWEKEFGKNRYYLADSFNEMEIPFPEIGTKERYDLLANYGEILYNSIKDANPEAVWVMQGWMFGYQRYIWEPRTLEALCSRVPDDKMLLLDEAVDYNKHFWGNGYNWDFYGGFFNKPWVYASIPNMGGKTGLTGILEFYANGHLDALNSKNRGCLTGFGMAPEGIENNEVIYELITDAGWRSDSVDVMKWLHNYSAQRYGKCTPSIDSAWKYLTRSVYGTFTDHPRYNWQMRPGTVRRGTINASEDMYRAIEFFAEAKIEDSELYKADLIELTAAYLGAKAEILIMAIENAYAMGETEKAAKLEKRFFEIMNSMDLILESHPTHRLDKWIELARKNGRSKELKDYYEKNARRIVTIWGPPVNDYSARIWSGLIRDYYIPRWQVYFQSKHQDRPFDHKAMAEWEQSWVEQTKGVTPCKPYKDPLKAATSLIVSAREISMEIMPNVIGNWAECTPITELRFSIPAAQLSKINGFRFNKLKGEGSFKIESAAVEADGKIYAIDITNADEISPRRSNITLGISVGENTTANNSCMLIIKASSVGLTGNVEMIFR